MRGKQKIDTVAIKDLYQTDYLLWLQETSQLLKAKDFERLDLENLIEEIESLGRSEQNKLISSLRLIYQHLLKWQYQPDKRSKSWSNTISRERDNISDYLEDTPSLKNLLQDKTILTKAYQRGKRDAMRETGVNNFPQESPYSVKQTLDSNFFPEN
ncbi:DUF29 domain-containing protein [Pleurocapsa sp. FMAR1]|uniref:DUF29 domain-containing protein n=1 Tax=Pleurocapsa sp. FMAR1 TaxID=3040204 RepID=UPI0029C8FD84|nr:DUF29 domain-containing protein [Pleurocapsa sp. FMAR1]